MNKFSMRLLPVACAAGLLLSACGGGGGGGEPAPTSPGMTASNYQEVGGAVTESVMSVMASADMLRGFAGLEGIESLGQASPRSADPVGLLRRVLDHRNNGLEQAQQTLSDVMPCQSGDIAFSATDADNNNMTSAGDSASFQFRNCSFDGEVTNGRLSMIVTRLDASSGALSINFNGFSSGGVTANGNASMSFTSGATDSLTVSLDNVTFNDGSTFARANYSVNLVNTVYSSSVSVTGNLVLDGHDYALTQPSPFVALSGATLQPGGVLQIREAAFGERVLVKADTGHFTYDYFSASNTGSTPDHSSAGPAF